MTKIVIVSGPTACGKTDLVHRLVNPETDFIINCDSRLFFRYLNIGTAKPSPKDLSRYHYRLVNFLDPGEAFSAYDFLHRCQEEIAQLQKKSSAIQPRIFLTGGSLFYTEILKKGLPKFPRVCPETKSHLQKVWEEKGLDYLTGILKQKDPHYYQEVDLKNPRRVLRALEILESGGQVSDLRKKRNPPPWDFLAITPLLPREILYSRIEERVEAMLASGWVEEVRDLLNRFSSAQIRRCHTIGYSEILDYLEGKADYSKTVSLIKQKTRRLAKQQIVWIKKDTSGYLFLNSISGYNNEIVFGEMKNSKFTKSADLWMNRYPRFSPNMNRATVTEPSPVFLITEKPESDLKKIIGAFYE